MTPCGFRGVLSWIASALALGIVLEASSASVAAVTNRTVILATTTSTQDSGLLEVLLPLFEKRTGYIAKAIPVGTGQALALAARGEADVCLVHAPEAEKRYVADGLLINRRLVMHNDFLLAGPEGDPAKVRGLRTAVETFRRIAEAGAAFVSRGDNSGTHQLEQQVWREARVKPEGSWYLQAGQGMGATLVIASEKRAYTLTDRGTYLAFRKRLQLVPLLEKERALMNVYSVLEANPERFPRVNATGGRALAEFLVSREAQEVIRIFGVERFGEPLFVPDAGKREEDL